jgi:NitT/TauT family transport system substrate-binding protein
MELARVCASVLMILCIWGNTNPVRAESNQLRIATNISLSYVPVVIMQEKKLIEKHAKLAGAGDITVHWSNLFGVNVMNDALLSGNLDIAFGGPPGLITIWAKTRGTKNEIKAISGGAAVPLYLVTRNPEVRSIRDLTEKDKIAVGAVKVSIHALLLQMAAAKTFGDADFGKLDPLTVAMPMPDAVAAFLSPASEINANVVTPPYNYVELSKGNGRVIMDVKDVVNGLMTNNLAFTTASFRDANPKLYGAFLKAMEEASEMVKRDPRGAVDLYLATIKFKGSPEDVSNTYRAVEDPGTEFSLTPHAVGKLADFMYQRGLIKVQPGSWRDLFFPEVHHLPGS